MERNQDEDFTDMTPKNLVLETVSPGIAIVKISRREALNALNTETLTELREVLRAHSADESIRVVILTGDGDKSFIAGADIAEMATKTPLEARAYAELGQECAGLLEPWAP